MDSVASHPCWASSPFQTPPSPRLTSNPGISQHWVFGKSTVTKIKNQMWLLYTKGHRADNFLFLKNHSYHLISDNFSSWRHIFGYPMGKDWVGPWHYVFYFSKLKFHSRGELLAEIVEVPPNGSHPTPPPHTHTAHFSPIIGLTTQSRTIFCILVQSVT